LSNKLTTIEQLRAAAERSAALSGQIAGMVVDAFGHDWLTVTLSAASWQTNSDKDSSAAGYGYYCEAAVSNLTENDSAESILSIDSLSAAKAANLCPTTDILAGKIRYYAAVKPTAAITMQVRPIYGVTTNEE
jgi:hypothetical protein